MLTWIVQPDVFTEDQQKESHLVLKELGEPTLIVEPYLKEPKVPFTDIIFRGSFGLMSWFNSESARKLGKHLINQAYWEPFSFSKLPTYFEHTLNPDIQWLPLNAVPSTMSDNHTLFVRPDSGKKLFSGQLFTKKKLETEIAYLVQRNADTTALVAVAQPKELLKEARFVVVGRKIVGYSLYSDRGDITFLGEVPEDLIKFANACMTENAFPEPHFVLDAVQTPNGCRVVEVNAIETSSYYNSDRKAIFSKLASEYGCGNTSGLLLQP